MKRCSVKPYEGDENYIFISYCHKDRRFVYPVIECLNVVGYRVWFDEGINPGTEWPEIIANHLNACAVCIAFISENAARSHNCRREINFALLKKKPFLSIFLEDVQLSLGMEMQLSAMQSILKFSYAKRNEFFNAIINTQILKQCLGIPNPTITISDDSVYGDDDNKIFASDNTAGSSFSDQWFKETIMEIPNSKQNINNEIKLDIESYIEPDLDTTDKSNTNTNESDNTYDSAIDVVEPVIKPSDESKVEDDNVDENSNKTVVMGKIDKYMLIKKGSKVKVEIDKFKFTIGRLNCDYTIKDNYLISRNHATILLKNGKCFVVDNNSRNKTFLNGKVIEPNIEIEINEFDEISFADVVFILGIQESEIEKDPELTIMRESIKTVFLLRKSNNEIIEINKTIFRIGRKQDVCDYVIADNASISRNHADIILKNDQYYIIDNRSANKTFVNKSEIPPAKEILINYEDEIKLGTECFIFKIK